jgi:outer membrane lipopolysaccharide assembly protein LptE/RlpB
MLSRTMPFLLLPAAVWLAGCGYHPVGSATHIPEGVHSVAVPIFENRTSVPRLELFMTEAVLHDLSARTQLQIVQQSGGPADATLRGSILTETVTPLTYSSNATTTTTSSYVITVSAKVVLSDAHGRVLFENDNYTFREVYQSTQQLSSFIQEDTPALERLAKEFAAALVSDMLESL